MFKITYSHIRRMKQGDTLIRFSPERSDRVQLQSLSGSLMPDLIHEYDRGNNGLISAGSLYEAAVWTGFSESPAEPAHRDGIETGLPDGRYEFALRDLYGIVDDWLFQAIMRSSQILYWRRRTRFCGLCGSPAVPGEDDLSMVCTECGETYYPQIAPAVIVAIRNGNKLLMVRNRKRPKGFYGLVAGFVEAGESLEEAVHREVFEETNLRVTNLEYARSQSWPFPNSHMIAFTADYAEGEIEFLDGELVEAEWFSPEEIPNRMPGFSVGSKLVAEFIRSQGVQSSRDTETPGN
ncbi:NAD(+) diphosphatase [Salinispira pacifica]|uniref:NAD(+) diphosphatase n=1 Tax=Salinispira pacifica TaxID=1307761 RepID=V5WMF3_9SPIO|nr:NAD(+) diphosphatase [Salinispira pacifica]AHC16830.1 NADH pyrophosphatase [Salinispira pacifica]